MLDAEPESIHELKVGTLSEFKQEIAHYHDSDFTYKKYYFEQVLAINPSDQAANLYCDRIENLMEQGISESWITAWSFVEK